MEVGVWWNSKMIAKWIYLWMLTLFNRAFKYSCNNNDNFHRPLIKKKLEQGTTLVVDRYAFSGVAFTSAKPVSLCSTIQNQYHHMIWHVQCQFRGSVWTGVSSLTWACQSQTWSCFCSSVQLRLLSEVNLGWKDMRPVLSKEQSNRNSHIWWRIQQSTGRYEARIE